MKSLLILYLLIVCNNAMASKFQWKIFREDDGSFLTGFPINDKENKFEIEDWICTIGEVKKDSSGTETRRFGCGIGNGLQVYQLTLCYKSKEINKVVYENGTFNLQMKKRSSVGITLGCE